MWKTEDEVTTTYGSIQLAQYQERQAERERIIAVLEKADAVYSWHSGCRLCEAIALVKELYE